MRLRHRMGIAAVRVWWPADADPVAEAVAAKRIERKAAEAMGYESLPVAADVSAPEMAVAAARDVMEAVDVAPQQVGLLLHAWMYYQGHDLWSPPHYVASELGMDNAVPAGVQQVCNGGAMAVELAAARLDGDPTLEYALVTTADRFIEPGFNRWKSDYGIAYGDGGTALLVHRVPEEQADGRPDELVLLSTATVAAAELERLHRGRDGFAPAPHTHSTAVDMRRTKKAYLIDNGTEDLTKTTQARVRQVVLDCLAEAGVAPDDPRLRAVVLPRLGRKMLADLYAPVIGEITAAEQFDLAARTGHLGPGDVAVSLVALREQRLIGPGEIALVLNAGAGFTWSCLAVELPA